MVQVRTLLQRISGGSFLPLAGIFACALAAQLLFEARQPEAPVNLPDSQGQMITNAAIPLFLTGETEAPAQRLESLIQETNIRQVLLLSNDQTLIARVVNGSDTYLDRPLVRTSFPVEFQGSLAGTVQVELADIREPVSAASRLLPATTISLVLTVCAWLLTLAYRLACQLIAPQLVSSVNSPYILETEPAAPVPGTSMILYIYPIAEPELAEDSASLRECIASFSHKLELHLRFYGGQILSLSDDRIVCRLPYGQSSADTQQAIVFAWGTARDILFRSAGRQYQISIKTLLHRSSMAARTGQIYRAINEIDGGTEAAVVDSEFQAHLSEQFIDALEFESSEFCYAPCPGHPNLNHISNIRESLKTLWQKQESILNSGEV